MFRNRFLRAAFFLTWVAAVTLPGWTEARQAIVIGEMSIGYDHWERDYDDEPGIAPLDSKAGDRRDWLVWPKVEVQYNGIHDTLMFRYAPVLRYDDIDSTTEVDHYLTLGAERLLSRKWRVALQNLYALSNDPSRYNEPFFRIGEQGEVPGETVADPGSGEQPSDGITQNLGRQRYWTNNLHLETSYAYAEEGNIDFGYSFRVLRNDDDKAGDSYDEYDRHEFFGGLSRRFTPSWRSELGLSYIKGVYDDGGINGSPVAGAPGFLFVSQDLEEYRADVLLEYSRDARNDYPFIYRYREVDYEDFRQDIWVHELAAGWRHSFDSRTHFRMGAGPSYVDADNLDGEWGINGLVNFSRDYQHANFSSQLSKSFQPRSFTGTDDTGMTDIVEARADLTYRFSKNLSSVIFASYQYEDILNPQGVYFLSAVGESGTAVEQDVGDVSYDRDIYSVGAALDYTFLRWFTATLRYVYYSSDGEILRDSYDDHRITLQLSAGKELWRF
jgi:hypothetical protein